MFLSKASQDILLHFDNPEIMAMEEVKTRLFMLWAENGVKKDTEFDTIWQLAKNEGKKEGVNEFIKQITNPKS
jgi:hypothetical protein